VSGSVTHIARSPNIFAEYLDGHGDRAIANGLNGISCPSERRRAQNRHRLADGRGRPAIGRSHRGAVEHIVGEPALVVHEEGRDGDRTVGAG
jgi:hypothetical protein